MPCVILFLARPRPLPPRPPRPRPFRPPRPPRPFPSPPSGRTFFLMARGVSRRSLEGVSSRALLIVLALPSPPAILALCPSSSKSSGFRAEPPAQHGHHPEGAERLAPRPTGPHHGKELAADARRAVQVAHAQMVLRVDGAEREQQSALIVEGLLQLVRTWA